MKPDRLAVFSYAHVPVDQAPRKKSSRKNPADAESKLEVLKLVIERLTAG
ncbi:MAG: hypothetical protein WDM80_10505 [Limisphaerales bacterium]